MDPGTANLYHEEFNPCRYLAERFSEVHDGDHRYYNEIRQEIARVPDDITKRKLIDVGCGPSVMVALLASGKYSEIHLCDYSPLNTEAIRSWLNGEAGCHDWSKYAEDVGQTEGISADTVEERAKENIRKVFECDILNNTGLVGCEEAYYDTVTCMGVVGAAASTIDDLHLAVKNMYGVLKPGGNIIIGSELGLPQWREGFSTYPHLNHSPKDMSDALVSAGLADIVMKDTPLGEVLRKKYGEYTRMFVTARKPLNNFQMG